jgi:hypothetical protein
MTTGVGEYARLDGYAVLQSRGAVAPNHSIQPSAFGRG